MLGGKSSHFCVTDEVRLFVEDGERGWLRVGVDPARAGDEVVFASGPATIERVFVGQREIPVSQYGNRKRRRMMAAKGRRAK